MAEPAGRGQRPARRSGLTSPDPVRTGYGPRRPPRTRPRARNPGHAAEQASGRTPTPVFTPENSSGRNRAGNELPELAGGSRLSREGGRYRCPIGKFESMLAAVIGLFFFAEYIND